MQQGKRNRLAVLRKYPNDPVRRGIMPTPDGFPREHLRLATVEQLTWDVLGMFGVDASGGPSRRRQLPDGSIVEIQTFPTKYPHIVIERTDHRVCGVTTADAITWSLNRVQNERAQTQPNRIFDGTQLLFELVRLAR